jgi:hypothetical protein
MSATPRGLIDVAVILQFLQSDRYMGKRAAAGYTGLSVRTLEGHPEIKRFRVGKKVLYRKSILDEWIEQHAETGPAPAEKSSLREAMLQAKKTALKNSKRMTSSEVTGVK